jgi:pSer/pThr/pTyr-binding forkhead associated (FHA) protein
LKQRDGTWTLTDLGSTNGTRLNGQTVQSHELSDGDTITIGTTVIEFRRD